MSLIRWRPAQERMTFVPDILEMDRNISRMFEGLFDDFDTHDRNLWIPPVDVEEKSREYVVRVELPGVARDDVHVTARENTLTIRGEKRQSKDTKERSLRRTERSYGSFQRSFTLPGSVNSGQIQASFNDGILEVIIPKAEEAKSGSIEIKVR